MLLDVAVAVGAILVGAILSIIDIDKTAPTFTATIQNVSSSGYDVIIKDVADVGSGIDRVQVPTWTESNGQDDIQTSWALHKNQ